MRFIRLATIHLWPAPSRMKRWTFTYQGVQVETLNVGGAEEGDPEEFKRGFTMVPDMPQAKARGSLAVMCRQVLTSQPRLVAGKTIEVPEAERGRAEQAIEQFADTLAVSFECARHIRSPSPPIALVGDDDAERAWLRSSNGIEVPHPSRMRVMHWVDIESPQYLTAVADRFDGVALLAEALTAQRGTGQFHDLIRLFERAFKTSPWELIDPLVSFLGSSPLALNYTRAEVERWLSDLRNTAFHADRKANFARGSDVQPELVRMQQAAYDVLLNKAHWRSSSSDRRPQWPFAAGVAADGHTIVATGQMPLSNEDVDPLGAWPKDWECHLTSLPIDWYTRLSSD